ncbi:hypothetical protein TVAG_407220 [Trichomonas vaginalis G3]|uniref:Uncharacterized protein n=1 Tax=Trichomonas vaginalis (strain ATCC PRA-98 / G3) TaxID=412133 RepID=A2F419_TRIV3|nr:armadillo (ARM) repeat-containing protein family [Trichomonas vaginalis G3]EAY00373.1 hypothetical protein TVAG_407220 [Trichomonas vaginalis G3]KAI5552358.1 armadillo (ARM) repeat-containing protein family [Trichomonas vaginalis G3]|eukprot:XP_001313302.1 hypothetical protein [Trichomonas vaginalis G3]
MSSPHDSTEINFLLHREGIKPIDSQLLVQSQIYMGECLEEIKKLFEIILENNPTQIAEVIKRVYEITSYFQKEVREILPTEVIMILLSYIHLDPFIMDYISLLIYSQYDIYNELIEFNIFHVIDTLFQNQSSSINIYSLLILLRYTIQLFVSRETEETDFPSVDQLLLENNIFSHLKKVQLTTMYQQEIMKMISALSNYYDLYDEFYYLIIPVAMIDDPIICDVFDALKEIISNNCTELFEKFIFGDKFLNFLLELLNSDKKDQAIKMFATMVYFGDSTIEIFNNLHIIEKILELTNDENESVQFNAFSFFDALSISISEIPPIFTNFNLLEYCTNKSFRIISIAVEVYLKYLKFMPVQIILDSINEEIISFCCEVASSENYMVKHSICLSIKQILDSLHLNDDDMDVYRSVLIEHDLYDYIEEI